VPLACILKREEQSEATAAALAIGGRRQQQLQREMLVLLATRALLAPASRDNGNQYSPTLASLPDTT